MGQQFSSSRLSLPPRQPKEPCDPLLALCPCCERRTDNLQQADICLRHVINCPKHALDCPIHSVRNINREEKSDEFILNTDRLVLSNGRQLLIERQITDDISNLNSECRFLYAENLNARNPENLSLSFERQESSIDKHLCSCCNSKIADLPLACRCLQSLAGASNACSLTPGIKVISEKNKQKSFDSLSCFSSRTKDSSENLAAERTSDCECTHVKKLKKIRSKSQESISHSDNHSLPPVYCCTCPVDRSVQSTLNSRRNTEASSSGCEECFMPLNRGDNDKCVNKVHHSKHSQVRCCRFTNSANRFGCSVDDESVQNYNFIKMSDDQSKHCDCCCGSVKTCDSPKEDEDLSSSSVAGPSSAVNKNIVNNNELLEEDHDSDLTLNRCVKSSSIDRYMSALSVDRSRRKRHDENKHSSCSKKLDMSGEDSKTSKVVKKKRGILSKICRQKNAAKFEPNVATSSKDPEACICTLHEKTSSIDVLPIDSVSPTESGTGEVSGERQSSADNDNSNAGRNLINITVARLGSHGSSNPVYGTIQGSNHLNYIVDSNGNSSNSVFVLSVTASGSEVCRLDNWRPPTTASSNPLTTVSAASSTGAGEERDRRSSQTSADIDNEESARERRAMEIIEGVEIGYKPDSSMVNCPWSVGIGQQHQLVLDGQQPLRIVLETSARIHTTVDYIHCLVPDLRAITACSFYWGKMDRYEAERLLENRPEGTFLLRDSAQEEYLFSVSFRKYNRSLHARIEQFNHRFSFDSHDPGVYAARTVTGLIEHYKDPACVMFFEPMLTAPLSRTRVFPLQHLCRAVIASSTDYDGVGALRLPPALKAYLKEYHYRQRVRITRFDVPHQEV